MYYPHQETCLYLYRPIHFLNHEINIITDSEYCELLWIQTLYTTIELQDTRKVMEKIQSSVRAEVIYKYIADDK